VAVASVSILTGSVAKNRAWIGLLALVLTTTAFAVGIGVIGVSSKSISMGREDNEVESLTSRLPLWEQLLGEFVSRRPLAGHGYGAFWTPDNITDVADTQGWSPGYAHSTYVDLLLSIGLIGTLLFVATMATAFVHAVRLEIWYAVAGFGFIAMMIAYLLADGALETTFGSTSFMSFFGICAVCYVLFAAPAPAPIADIVALPGTGSMKRRSSRC
jgi:O-antigen ligase